MSDQDELFGTPTAAELVEAVVEFLEKDVAGELSGRRRFHLRVAVNALNIVLRQLELNDLLAEQAEQALSSMGVASERELAEAIRAGQFDERDDLPAALRLLVSARLQVNNPTYLETYS
ncbi:MAG TPA: DUF6285 domain-containing protein [Acidimicrobiales bacterium]|nr:DUF6285 domain-containing protein [Acidimicrobiales bacterium]